MLIIIPKKKKMFQIKFVIFIIILNYYNRIVYSLETPCTIDQSIVLNSYQKQDDDSYLVDDGTKIPKNLTFTITDQLNNKLIVRGCICLIKTCVPWCCPYLNQTMQNLKCTEQKEDEIFDDVTTTLIKSNGTIIENVSFMKQFYLQKNRNLKCDSGYTYAFRHLHLDEDVWEVHENGSLVIITDLENQIKAYVPQNEFCFALHSYDENDLNNTNVLQHVIGPHICIENPPDEIRHKIFGICLLVSQPFMIITIIIYLAIPKLRNLHGKALVCYLSSLSISYFGLAYILLGKNHDEHFGFCTFVGYVVYVTILSAYFWLSAISFDLWYNFNNYDKARAYQNVRFLTYCGICYGTALIYMITAYLVQNSGASDSVKPGMGTFYCYLNVETGYSAVIWLYGPLSCVIIFNITMFILTWRNIKAVSYELSRVMDKRNLKSERNQFHIFLRLFVIMGVSWVAEIASYFVGQQYQHFFYVTDFFNVMQGLLIFILFVLKNDTKKLILKRYDQIRGNRQYSRQYSRTTSSNMVSMNQL
ncbi:G-protein coupled receptor Mth2-like isoform X2 [Condylostylus longicornis]|uniref:G-protein coupled receptor Mth2-like isoform X2 n=1 Tax=Condylostylus longicornis TaxID=2530218 RepID=UPI00244E0046|nr:G-protein coupled receptor Mth2-like isoform X2 [Condylostylus longicornis]